MKSSKIEATDVLVQPEEVSEEKMNTTVPDLIPRATTRSSQHINSAKSRIKGRKFQRTCGNSFTHPKRMPTSKLDFTAEDSHGSLLTDLTVPEMKTLITNAVEAELEHFFDPDPELEFFDAPESMTTDCAKASETGSQEDARANIHKEEVLLSFMDAVESEKLGNLTFGIQKMTFLLSIG